MPEARISTKESEPERLLWEVLEKLQYIPTYHSGSKEEILFELGKIYSQTYDRIQEYRKSLFDMKEAVDKTKFKMEEDAQQDLNPSLGDEIINEFNKNEDIEYKLVKKEEDES